MTTPERKPPAIIYKYPTDPLRIGELRLPAGAEILHAAMQHQQLTVWALVDPSAPLDDEPRLLLYGTGHPIPHGTNDIAFVATVFDGALVWHVFERI